MNTKALQGQVALVTGASSGIGKAIAIAFAEAGAKVGVNYRSSAEDAEQIVSGIREKGGEAVALQANVAKEDQVQRLFSELIETYGTIDILVNNAGLQKDANFIDMSLEDWQLVIDVNLTGQFLCAREAAKEFIRRGVVEERSCAAGKIICISSVHEKIPWATHANYAASKGGINMLMRTIAQELAPHKIRVNSIAPGAIKTPINRQDWENEEAKAELLNLIPYQRIGKPEDVARMAVWLASDDSDYVVGETLFIDGGMMLYPGFAEG
ncbi:MAG: SDR family oxidoreductase [Coleofasciculus sp. B1-GNL1-01]|uniref:SDR family oxidoreductase n=1 Tax=Coleofasciculus sp. B1-GNL1-01 TaxID=3068484 RepID=UPI0032F5D7F3